MREVPLERVLARLSRQQGVSFAVAEREIPAAVVFGEEAYMPAIAMAAEGIARDAFGVTLGIRLERDTRSILGMRVSQPVMISRRGLGTLTGLCHVRAMQLVFDLRSDVSQQRVDLNVVLARLAEPLQQLDIALRAQA